MFDIFFGTGFVFNISESDNEKEKKVNKINLNSGGSSHDISSFISRSQV
jgi:hypothetical protein